MAANDLGELFNQVAQGLIDIGKADGLATDTALSTLALQLKEQGWDTVEASVQMFWAYPVIRHALLKAQGPIWLRGPDDRVEGIISFEGDCWVLRSGTDALREPGTIAGFNELLQLWAFKGWSAGYHEAAAAYRID